MLDFKAQFTHKPDRFYPHNFVIEKVVELPGLEFDRLVAQPCESQDFIAENRHCMWMKDRTYHCLLVLGENRADGILIESEGADYPRYASYLAGGRAILEYELELAADYIIKNAAPDASSHSRAEWFKSIEEVTGLKISEDNGIGAMLLDTLRQRPEIAEAEIHQDCFEIICQAETPDTDATAALRQRIRENMLAFERDWYAHDATWLIAHAEEIAATKQAYNDIFAYAYEKHMEYLLRFQNPLEVVRDSYVEGLGFSQEADLCCSIDYLMDQGYAEQNYELAEAPAALTQDGMEMG